MTEGYTRNEIHVFDPDEEENPDELPQRVKYAPLLQEEEDFLPEEDFFLDEN